MTSDEYAQILDDFELNAPGDVMPGESLTEYINRRRREFESKADGGSIGIEVLFGPKREEYQTGGQAYSSKATAQDYAKALQNVSAGTTYQQQAAAEKYAKQQANIMLEQAMKSADPSKGPGLQGIYDTFFKNKNTGIGPNVFSPGASGKMISYSSRDKDRILDTMANQMLDTTNYSQTKKRNRKAEAEAAQYDAYIQAFANKQAQTYGKASDYAAEAMTLGMPVEAYYDYLVTGDEKDLQYKYQQAVDGVTNPYYDAKFSSYSDVYGPNLPRNPYQQYFRNVTDQQTQQGIPTAQRIQQGQVMGLPGAGASMSSNPGYQSYASLLAANKKMLGLKDGGRVGLFMGGPALEGQALNIYNSMNSYGFSDEEIANALQGQGLYTPDGVTELRKEPPNIQPIGFQGGGGGDITELQKTYTTETAPPQKFTGDPTAQLTGKGRLDPMGSGFYETLESVTAKNTNELLDKNELAKKAFFQDVYQDPKDISFVDKTKKTLGSFKDKFFQPKVKGTLGDRLLKQSQEGIMSKVPLPGSMFAKLRSPFNPESPTYNAALPMQLNFLEATTGKKITGTSDNLKVTEGLEMIGRDPNTGGLKYGAGSVLAGKNVISGFGTNDYETALRNYISKMASRAIPGKPLTTFQQAKLDQANAELEALMAKQAQEYIDSGKKAEVAALQKEIDSGKYSGGSSFAQSNQAAVGGGAKGKAANTDNSKSTGTSQGYSQHYAKGGLATMFTRRR